MSSEEIPYLWDHGLTETTEEYELCYSELQDYSVPFTAHWEDQNNAVKAFQQDTDWEKYIKHCADLEVVS